MAARQEDLRLFSFSGQREQDIRDAIIRALPSVKTPDSGGTESTTVVGVRKVLPKDLPRILVWFSDSETQGHLDPLPKLPEDWKDENQVIQTVLDLGNYYDNQGEPDKIYPVAVTNDKDEPLGVATIRWRGDPWLPKGHKIASIERVVVDPALRGEGVGSRLMSEAEKLVFDKGYPEVRVWVMTDEVAGADKGGNNLHFFRERGYDIIRGSNYSWRDYAKARNLGENAENREALWLSLKREDWIEREKKSTVVVQQLTLQNGQGK